MAFRRVLAFQPPLAVEGYVVITVSQSLDGNLGSAGRLSRFMELRIITELPVDEAVQLRHLRCSGLLRRGLLRERRDCHCHEGHTGWNAHQTSRSILLPASIRTRLRLLLLFCHSIDVSRTQSALAGDTHDL